jgi:hypothetical protein
MNGVDREIIVARRYLVAELAATYAVSARASVGTTYLYLRGVEDDAARHTHFAALRAALAVALPGHYAVRLLPQAYYLNTARRTGYFAYASATLTKLNLPISLAAAANGPLRTSITAGKDLVWNLSVGYAIP